MPVLLDRFRNHALRKFAQHGLTSIGYWLNTVGGPNDELVYVLAFDDLAQRDQAWAAFVADEECRPFAPAPTKTATSSPVSATSFSSPPTTHPSSERRPIPIPTVFQGLGPMGRTIVRAAHADPAYTSSPRSTSTPN